MGQDRKAPGGTPDPRETTEAGGPSTAPPGQGLSPAAMSALIQELKAQQDELARQNEALRRTQTSLEAAVTMYRGFYECAPVGFVTLNASGLIREVNLTAVSQLEAARRSLIHQPLPSFLHPEDQDLFRHYLRRVFQDPGPRHCEVRLQRPDGGIFFARLASGAVTDSQGERVCPLSISDISDLKEAERKLDESERLFAAFMEHLPGVAVIRDPQGRYLYANATWEQTFQKNREGWRNQTSDDLWPPEVAAKFKEQDRLVLESGQPLQSLITLTHADGPHHWIYSRFPIVDQEGRPVMIGVNAIDVTERLETRARLEQALASGPAVMYTREREGNFALSYVSENTETLVGWEPRDFLADSRFWLDHLHPEDRPQVCKGLELPWPQDHQTFEYRFLAKDGAYRWMHDEVRLVRDVDGKPVEMAGVWMDITARKETETIIHRERQRFFSLLDMLPASVCLVAPDFSVPFANRYFREIFGDPEGRTCHELAYDRPSPCDACTLKEILETRKPTEWERTIPHGPTYQIYSYPFADFDGSPMVLKLGVDITQRKALEAQLLQAQKMEAIGRLAGGVAHDFNNLLMAIMGYGELIRSSLVPDDPLFKYSDDILKATERAASLTQQLLAFSRRQAIKPQVLDLNRELSDLEKMLQRLIGEHIDLEIKAGPDLGPVKADAGQIGHIIMNLAVNARDAMPTGGRLILSTANIDFAASHLCRYGDIPPGSYVSLTARDTGSGMDAETLDHIFEPFFTTKEVGQGTGLGLPMVYGMVKQNRGWVDVESRPGLGTTFTIYLPRLEAAAPEETVSEAAKLEGGETILVVEDEDALRTLLCRFFRLYGYNVLEARHGGEALLIGERHQGPIHLMVTDVVMPQMSGKDLAGRMAPMHPEMTVFFMSGYADGDLTAYGAPEPSQHFVPKPFRPMDLVKKVRDILDAARGGPANAPRR
jgi:two-component system cell cycle sensor histidine kinase/response regulator CckA